jgi:hypothetical protein
MPEAGFYLLPGFTPAPAFEFITHDGHAFRVWPDGSTEGFPSAGTTINRIPLMLRLAEARNNEPLPRADGSIDGRH